MDSNLCANIVIGEELRSPKGHLLWIKTSLVKSSLLTLPHFQTLSYTDLLHWFPKNGRPSSLISKSHQFIPRFFESASNKRIRYTSWLGHETYICNSIKTPGGTFPSVLVIFGTPYHNLIEKYLFCIELDSFFIRSKALRLQRTFSDFQQVEKNKGWHIIDILMLYGSLQIREK